MLDGDVHYGGGHWAGMPRAVRLISWLGCHGRWCHELGCSCFTCLTWIYVLVKWLDLCDLLRSRVHKMLSFSLTHLRHPLGRGLFRICNVTYATVVSLRGSVGTIHSICSAMSYVAVEASCVYAWMEYPACRYLYCWSTGFGWPLPAIVVVV